MAPPVIAVEGLCKEYKRGHLGRTLRQRGVRNISFTVNEKEIFGLLGLNASGKTTTIKLLLGLLLPNSGSIQLFGKPISQLTSLARVGFLPEVPNFYSHLTAGEILTLFGTLSHIHGKKRNQRIEEVLALVNLSDVKNRLIREYSKGMLQRLGLAQALLHNPDLLILDEPVTGLDPLGIRQIRQLIADFHNMGKSVLFSSHSISELERLSHRVGILVDGELAAIVPQSAWAGQPGLLEEIFIETIESFGKKKDLS